MVAVDDQSNGYRVFLLPLACEEPVVRYALLAASASHLESAQSEPINCALRFQSAAINALSTMTKSTREKIQSHICKREHVLAAIVLLLVNVMVAGGDDFQVLLRMARSWIAGTSEGDGRPESALMRFLREQLDTYLLFSAPPIPQND